MFIVRNVTVGIRGYFDYVESSLIKKQERFIKADLEVSLENDFILFTGATGAMGKAAAIEMAKRGATLYLVVRDLIRGEEVRKEIIERTLNNKVEVFLCNLSEPQQCVRFVQDFLELKKPLTTIVANAGVLKHELNIIDCKYEYTFAVNTLSAHILVRSLLPLLEGAENPKVLITSSSAALVATLDKDCAPLNTAIKFDGTAAHQQTKRQGIEMARAQAKNYPKVFFASWHPG